MFFGTFEAVEPGVKRRRALALALALASGAAGLAHQLLWTRRLVDVLGADAATFAAVAGAFFLGLGAGSWRAAHDTATGAAAWTGVARAEMITLLLSLVPVLSPLWSGWFDSPPSLWPGARIWLPLLLVAPPAAAMGLVMPRLIAAVSGDGPRPGVLYAVNTLGGILGIVLVLLVLLPSAGLQRASLAVVAVNGALAVLAWRASRQGTTAAVEESVPPARSRPLAGLLGLSMLSGGLTLGVEVMVQKQVAQVAINALWSGGAVLAGVLGGLAVGAVLSPWLQRRAGASLPTVGLVLTALVCAVQPVLFHLKQPALALLPYQVEPLAYAARFLALALVTFVPVFVAAGVLFPWLLEQAAGSASPRRAVGLVYAFNGVGGWLGAMGFEHLLAPGLGLWRPVVLAGVMAWAVALLFRPRWVVSVGLALTVIGMLWLCRYLPPATLQAGERLVAFRAAPEGMVVTVRRGADDWRVLFNNSYTLGGSLAQLNQERQAHLPLLLHGRARRVALMGVATGGTLGGAVLHREVEQIDAMELSPAAAAMARDHFGPFNRNALRDARVRLQLGDARLLIRQGGGEYDVVVGDLFLPWRSGEGRLFTREHFSAVRERLAPGGLYCQWLPMFQFTREQFDAVLRTFREVFPDVFVVRGDFYSDLPVIGLVGGRSLSSVDWEQVRRACDSLRQANETNDPLMRHAEGVAMMVVGVPDDPGAGPVITLDNAWLECRAGHDIVGLREPWLTGVPLEERLRAWHRASHGQLPAPLRDAHQAGDFCITLEMAARIQSPALPNLIPQIGERLPAALRDDSRAGWERWPMSAFRLRAPARPQDHRING